MVECWPIFYSQRAEPKLSGLIGNNLTSHKQDRCLFQHLHIRLRAGELVHLKGPNGAGKSSLMRILVGLSSPEEGNVSYDGVDISEPAVANNIVFIGHKSGLNGLLSAEENLTYWSAQHQLDVSNAEIYEALAALNLVGMEEVPIKNLSAGQQRRVALARLWLKPATYWLLDEPFTSLDAEGITLMETAFAEHVSKQGAILMTSHQALSERVGRVRVEHLDYRL
ncbi:cytochrome c biogenesis heme-transporting ATPase CcmA [Alteromonas ponticola]|uniref:Cytochrome c biogenesis heme-transporting ATPase CcmA n=1 Tax=Alteromonas aquimaris TaxID=2998417 RepID=A0ABT3P2G0_9ALTE|nr:cytochrome c biogenesis heme-transporting ATPase CcmA [Alteromonas aquimaris]MCW8106956.1 cytochrome c biogenesis heme-transporting ATPase CcmA [Alteromonas aquimaris]